MSLLLAGAPALLLTAVSAPAMAQGNVIRDIQVEGNRRVEAESVRSYVTLQVGDAYDAGKADESLNALFGTGLFSDVRIDRQGGTLIIVVVENPVISRVAFEGNSEVEDATLGGEVQLRAGAIFTKAKVQADVTRIQGVYQKQGLFAASVEPKIIALEQNRVDLVYEITEGPSTKVNSISFVGNRNFTDSQLKEVVTTNEKNWLSWLKSTDIYDPDRMNLDRELLRQFYLKNGYADMQVLSATADLDPSGKGFFLTFSVDEGVRYTFGAVQVESAVTGVEASSLSHHVLTQPGQIYNAAQIDKTIEKLTLALSEQGHAFAVVRPRADRDPATQTIALTYSIEDGPRSYIERIDIVGNIRTEDKVIRREFKLVEGDAFNKLLVSRAKQRLQGLGFFKSVDVLADQGSAADRVVLTVQVLEDSTGEVSLGGGYSSAEGVIADVSFKERNLMGKGQYLSLSLSGSFERMQVDLSFTEPRFLDQNLSAGFDLFHKEQDYRETSGYKSRRSGGGLRLGVPLSEQSSLSTRYQLVRDEVFDVTDEASNLFEEGENWVSSLGYTVNYDTRNIKNNPSSGVYLEFSQDVAGLGGDVYYVRSMGEGRAYYPVTEKVTLVGRLVGGNISGWNDQDIRTQDLFFRGGETVRGFDRSGYGPRDMSLVDPLDPTKGVKGTPLGGQNYIAATAEVRFPLPMVPDDLGLSGAAFADAGTVFGVPDTIASKVGAGLADEMSIRSSVGLSLIWNSPLGPLRADYAYVLSKEEYDQTQSFRFGASTKF